MRVLLLAMPDTADVIDFFGKLPNLGLVNLAGNLPGHEVKVVDLVLYKPRVRRILKDVLASFRPELVGLSAMTFQFDTLLRVARFLRRWDSAIKLAAGGYHATLMAREIAASDTDLPLDFLIRGEGEVTFQELVNQLAESEPGLSQIVGLSYRQGAQAVFFADDNLTYDIPHFRRLCRAIVDQGLNDLHYATQASAVGLARHPELVDEMKRANFWMVFVGFESMSAGILKAMHKPTSPEINRRAAALLRQHDIGMIAGVIFGYPEDTRASVTRNYRLMKKMRPDLIYSQYLTPYPKTQLRRELLQAGLVVNADDFRTYDGFHCNIRTRNLDQAALYQSLKRESLKSYFDPSLYVRNFFLRHSTLAFFRAIGRAMLSILSMVLRGRQPVQKLDI